MSMFETLVGSSVHPECAAETSSGNWSQDDPALHSTYKAEAIQPLELSV